MDRGLARAAAASASTRVSHPLARYDEIGKLHCKVCKRVIDPATWNVHLASVGHKSAIAQASAVQPAAPGTTARPENTAALPAAAASTAAPAALPKAALPADFFDIPRGSAAASGAQGSQSASTSSGLAHRAHQQQQQQQQPQPQQPSIAGRKRPREEDATADAPAAQRQPPATSRTDDDADAALTELLQFASGSDATAGAEGAAGTDAEAEGGGEDAPADDGLAADAENLLYKARAQMLAEVVRRATVPEAAIAAAAAADSEGDTALTDELLGPSSLLAGPAASRIDSSTITSILSAKRIGGVHGTSAAAATAAAAPAADSDSDSGGLDDLLDWRKKAIR